MPLNNISGSLACEMYDLSKVSGIESSIAGLLGGFSLTIAAIMISKINDTPSDRRRPFADETEHLSIASFASAVFYSIASSYLFGVVSALQEPKLAWLTFLLPVATFVTCIDILFFGLAMALRFHCRNSECKYMFSILLFSIFITEIQTIITSTHVIGMINDTPASKLSSATKLAATASSICAPILALLYRCFGLRQNTDVSVKPHVFSVIVIFICIINVAMVDVVEWSIVSKENNQLIPYFVLFINSLAVSCIIIAIPRDSLPWQASTARGPG
jgi:hypothetical protein